MKKVLSIMTALLMVFAVATVSATGSKDAAAPAAGGAAKTAFHIGVVTGTVSQSEDDLRGAEELIKRYGKVSDGGMIQHITYPDNFMEIGRAHV